MTPSGQLTSAATGVDSVLARMRALYAALPPEDGVAVFNRVYLKVTEALRGRIADGYFPDPYATAELGTVFAERYLAAVDAEAAGRRAPACWRPLFQSRGHRGVRPVQFALAGINAHVGHDLPMAVVDACEALGTPPHAMRRDYERVGRMLGMLEDRIREELMPDGDVREIGDALLHLAGAWSLDAARDAAWDAAQVLWRLRELPHVYAAFTDRLDAGVGLVSRCLLTPLN
ncbi:DUF5995 family protein [Streptantibioticus rubrisoli]|uniref:DUF5995 family protein n=1 Tax=Streptantibioticus rubrisoli TaxID=1387313 RepID=A0ABT1PMW7_9ACTN|nr:DUF5995 family protein [Streptantibioticus rubrisoli]MCQ4046705.1 DUF5995 family protein [Streptantibioticus rubrisoli]